MTIDWLRDLFIIIFAIIATGVLLFIGFMTISLYRRAKLALDAILDTAEMVRAISSFVKNEVSNTRPLVQAMTIIQGIREGVDIINRLFRNKR
ncbi:MAG: hypothetical protein Q8O16_04280 [Dehalococcoidia bacterium]|nr:hypothetical protein [Dehalococcoidia bacterium]